MSTVLFCFFSWLFKNFNKELYNNSLSSLSSLNLELRSRSRKHRRKPCWLTVEKTIMEPVHDPVCKHPEEKERKRRRCWVKLLTSESACKSLSTQQMKSEWKLKYTQLNSQSQSTIFFFLSPKLTPEKINKTPNTDSPETHIRIWNKLKWLCFHNHKENTKTRCTLLRKH